LSQSDFVALVPMMLPVHLRRWHAAKEKHVAHLQSGGCECGKAQGGCCQILSTRPNGLASRCSEPEQNIRREFLFTERMSPVALVRKPASDDRGLASPSPRATGARYLQHRPTVPQRTLVYDHRGRPARQQQQDFAEDQ